MRSPRPDLEIIKKILDGENEFFAELVKKYQEKVWRLCVSMLGKAHAEEAAQEIFIRIYESLEQFKGESAFSTWIYRIASNHCLNILAKRKRERKESLEELLEKHGDRVQQLLKTASEEMNSETKEIVESLLSQLSPEERTILTLRELEGFSYKEIAETLEISIDAVKVRIFRARTSLKKSFQNLEQCPPSKTKE